MTRRRFLLDLTAASAGLAAAALWASRRESPDPPAPKPRSPMVGEMTVPPAASPSPSPSPPACSPSPGEMPLDGDVAY